MRFLKFKTISIIVTLILIIFLSSNSLGKTNVIAKEKLIIYSNAKYGIKISYPDNWNKEEGANGILVIFQSPLDKSGDNGQESTDIIVDDSTMTNIDISLKEYIDTCINNFKSTFDKFNLISRTKTTIGGVEADKIVYTDSYKKKIIRKYMQVYAVKNKKVYIFTYEARNNWYDKYIKIVNNQIKSFKFLK